MAKCYICGKSIKYNRYIKYKKEIYCLKCWNTITKTTENNKQFTEEVDLEDLED